MLEIAVCVEGSAGVGGHVGVERSARVENDATALPWAVVISIIVLLVDSSLGLV